MKEHHNANFKGNYTCDIRYFHDIDTFPKKSQSLVALAGTFKFVYYMASNSSVQIECSDWLVFGRDFTVRTITIETVLFGYFFFRANATAKFPC